MKVTEQPADHADLVDPAAVELRARQEMAAEFALLYMLAGVFLFICAWCAMRLPL